MTEQFQSNSWYRVAELTPRLRSHGTIRHHRYRGTTWYVMHDPSSGRVHRFTPAAYAFIRAMDGKTTVDELWTRMASSLEINAPTQDDVIRLLSQLYEADMLHVERLPNAEAFLHLVSRHRRSKLMNAIRNPLSVTFPLWDPDAFLNHFAAPARKLLSGWALLLWAIVVVPAFVLAGLHFRELTENVTDRLLSVEGLVLIALTFPLVKVLHELGHALALKALGGEVHQVGVMMIAFYPVPYVDASAAAMLSSKRQRILVSAAGMMVELVLASVAMYVWILAEPGIVRSIAYDVIVIAGVSTLIVNGNPLLRFDGYFILSDLIEIPNLAQRGSRFWSRLTMRGLFGLRVPEMEQLSAGERGWFLVYGPLSFLYRMLVLVSLSLFIATEYFIVGIVIAVVALTSAIVVPLARGIGRLLSVAQLQAASQRTRVRLAIGTAAITLAVFVLPLPVHSNAEGVVWLPEDAYVRAGADGFISRILQTPGSRAQKGALLIESQDVFLRTQIALHRQRIQELEVRLPSERFSNRSVAEITQMELAEEYSRLAASLDKQERLVARSEREGAFIVPQPMDLPGRFHRKGDTLGYIVPDQGTIVRGIVLQDNIDLVRHRLKRVRFVMASDLREEREARIVREVPAGGDEVPSKALLVSGGGSLAPDPKDPKGLKVTRRVFQFDLAMAAPPQNVAFGERVYLRFEHLPEPVAIQVYRRVRQLFLSRFNA